MSKSNSELLLARRKNAIANGVGVFNTTTVRTSKGATIIDLDGRELIDFTGGIGVIIAGNSTPNMKVAAKEVFGPLVHELVVELTDLSKLEDGNRAVRKGIDADRLAVA